MKNVTKRNREVPTKCEMCEGDRECIVMIENWKIVLNVIERALIIAWNSAHLLQLAIFPLSQTPFALFIAFLNI